MKTATKTKRIIGRIEKCSFPELGLLNVEAKIDTGAFTSAIHCVSIEESVSANRRILEVCFDKTTRKSTKAVTVQFRKFSITRVRSSSGKLQKRYTIRTKIKIGKRELSAQFTLTNRSKMKYPVLIGRKILSGRFIVDVGATFAVAKNKKQSKKKNTDNIQN